MTTNFYAPPSSIRGKRITLPEEEARHARSVLRAEPGEEIVVVDGEGGWYRVTIDHITTDRLVGTVQESREEVGEPDVDVTVALGMLTKRSRFETFVEKAVELGVRRIVPLLAHHSETDTLRGDRIRRVMIAALKQCRRSRLPSLAEPQSLDQLLQESTAGYRLLCHNDPTAEPVLDVLNDPSDEVLALVGPEGGFSSAEIESALAANCTLVSLGNRRLRAETAGLSILNAVTLRSEARHVKATSAE